MTDDDPTTWPGLWRAEFRATPALSAAGTDDVYPLAVLNMRPVEKGILAARNLAAQVIEELDPTLWSHESTDPRAAAELADYVVGATQAVAGNLQTLIVHFDNYKVERYAQDGASRLNFSKSNRPYPTPPEDKYNEREIRLDAYERAVFVSIGSTLDTLAASLIGFTGLELDIHRADFGWLLPMGAANYPTRTKNKKLVDALAPGGTSARVEQIKAVRAFAAAIEASGPKGWLSWALAMRNMYVHREHRTEFIVFGRDKAKTLTIDRVPPANPSDSNLHALGAATNLLAGYYLTEDIEQTMAGLISSLDAAVTGTVEVLRHLWDRRKADPTLVPQPSAQWVPQSFDPMFKGYSPGSAEIREGVSALVSPQDASRMTAGGLVTGTRTTG